MQCNVTYGQDMSINYLTPDKAREVLFTFGRDSDDVNCSRARRRLSYQQVLNLKTCLEFCAIKFDIQHQN